MITASFLCKDLLINWQLGEQYFMQHLVDGDLASNNGGWQWTAGTGTDAQPYFRIFNPTSQALKFDPEGAYVRRWVPELANVPAAAIHAPWNLSNAEKEYLKCTHYPDPVVDHSVQRQRALELYRSAGKEVSV
jgi:deoxyribodipyrimidine photo-lyase